MQFAEAKKMAEIKLELGAFDSTDTSEDGNATAALCDVFILYSLGVYHWVIL